MLSIDERMVPIIQAILQRQAHKMGRQDFILTESRNDYLYDAEVYVGKSDDTLHPELGAESD